ncbi:MAG: hypothetical protein IT475_06255, partial [Aquimonas sp.]|nr:hypothetical protein [Aquimonas sp.]
DSESFTLRLHDGSLSAKPERDAQNRLQLVLPKIGSALSQWISELADPQRPAALAQLPFAQSVRGVLVLSTDRGTEEQEPIATFTVLKRWLVSKGVTDARIQESVFIGPRERLEDGNSPINPAIAQRIEEAVTKFYDRSGRSPLLIGTMGGLPQIKPLLAELAVLLAGEKARSLFKSERGSVGLLPRTPIDALRLRRQCLERLRRGALLDAWTIAAPFRDDPGALTWVRPLEQAARLLNGNPVGAIVELPALQTLIDHADTASCLLVAIRVETALQNERWLEAINGSLTFLEAAFHDELIAWAKENLAALDLRRRFMRFRNEPAVVLENNGAIAPWRGHGAGPLTYQANMVGDKALDAWGTVFNSEPLRDLREVIHARVTLANGSHYKLSDYRNYNTHGVMTQDEIDDALKRFMGANLWSQGTNNSNARPGLGKCFLNRPLVSNVIRHLLGMEVSPLSLYQDLLNELEARMIAP